MARIRTNGTAIERAIRRELSNRGIRYRLNVKALPGTPDVYIGRLKLAVFTHGCFWHGHECRRGTLPKLNYSRWRTKIARNRERDRITVEELQSKSIGALILWGCEVHSFPQVAENILLQYNKRDLPSHFTIEHIETTLWRS